MTSEKRSTQHPIAWIGRYALFDELARGGMASVHVGRLSGPAGFSKTVAIKKMLDGLAANPNRASMFLDEARLAGRLQHPNVVSVFDVIAERNAVYLVMEYVDGLPLSELCSRSFERQERVAPTVAVHVLRDVLYGLQAAHEATNERGESLRLIHRDVSPQNILVGADGVSRVLDFGIAKAEGRQQDTDTGQIKGKVSYMAPEQLLGQPIDPRVDIFSAGVVLWEALSGRRLFAAKNSAEAMYRVLEEGAPLLTDVVPELPQALAQVVARATAKAPQDRFGSALEFAVALESSVELIPNHVVGRWVLEVGGDVLGLRRERVRDIESIAIPPQPAPVPTTAALVAPSAAFVPASPDDETRDDGPITVSSQPPPAARPWPKLALVAATLAAGTVVWFVSSRPHPPAAPAIENDATPAPTAAAAAPAAPTSSATSAPSALVVAPSKSASPPARERPKRSAEPRKPRLPPPESLFSRE